MMNKFIEFRSPLKVKEFLEDVRMFELLKSSDSFKNSIKKFLIKNQSQRDRLLRSSDSPTPEWVFANTESTDVLINLI